ncbi:uncharacterized protein B0P05DRAFT_572470 [Gilbertella persicaria]|uniref:uncharacterized protein n=1 Tax=Gilbertella persicaria TaxID=101096 RepID=UPI00222042B9|nr:uncharacterized protein B0P05DRAFT_572470 [Gilbertella persicaria]KAI8076500.1 hypothetical protein B0P05DRAFT_572470 [Gilbertella persicaria]
MNIKLSDLVNDVLAVAKDKTQSMNHVFNTTATDKPAVDNTATTDKPAVDNTTQVTVEEQADMSIIIPSKQEEEEVLTQDAITKMKYKDHQFILLCKKFTDIRNTLMSIQHSVIPSIPSIVVIGSRQSNANFMIEMILGQPFLSKALEFEFVNDSNLSETRMTWDGQEKWYSIQEGARQLELGHTPTKVMFHGPYLPCLHLYDIPEHHSMVNTYIHRDPYAVILAIHDTSLSFSASPTAKLCHHHDPGMRRTLPILTGDTAAYKDQYPAHYLDMSTNNADKQLKSRLWKMLEQAMQHTMYRLIDTIQTELGESSYLFKVIYNDRQLTPASYLTDTMDALKAGFKGCTAQLSKPQLRSEVRHLLEQNVLDVCAEQYWSDANIRQLSKAHPDDFYWLYKMDLASAAITKSGIGRITTQWVIDVVMAHINNLVKIEPFQFHGNVQQRIVDLTQDLLRKKYVQTSDQVENTIKPYKYEVEVTEAEWKDGVKRTIRLLEKELAMCEDMLWTLKKTIGRKRLRSAIRRVLDTEQTEQPSSRILEKAQEALFLQDRAMIIKYRLAALKSRQCKSFENKQYCPEAFLTVVADKLAYTAVMFIQIELLNDFFADFPVEVIDNRIIHPMSPEQIDKFAKENPSVQKHLVLQEKKMKLQEVMDLLDYLVKRHDIE